MKDALKPKVETSAGRAWIFSSGGFSLLSRDAERFVLIGAMIFAITLPLPISWISAFLSPVPPLAKVQTFRPEFQAKTTTPFFVDVETDRQICRDAKPLRPKRP